MDMLETTDAFLATVRDRLRPADEPYVATLRLAATAIDNANGRLSASLLGYYDKTYRALLAAVGDGPSEPEPAFRFYFEEPDKEDPDWRPNNWALFCTHDVSAARTAYVERRDELLSSLEDLMDAADSDPAIRSAFD